MNHQTKYVKDNPGETSQSPASPITTYYDLPNSACYPYMEHNGNCDLSRQINETVKYIDYQNILVDQKNAVMELKLSEYQKALADRENTIISLHTDIINSQKNNDVLISQYKNIIDKTKSVTDTCVYLNTCFTNICDRFNILGETVANASTGQKDVMDIVCQTANEFEEKILNISVIVEDSMRQMKMEKIKAKQELEILENKYSNDLVTCKTDIEKFTIEIDSLKSENIMLLEKLDETHIMLNKEKEITFNLNLHFENELKLKEDQSIFLINQNKYINSKLNEIEIENQSLKDKVTSMKNAIDEREKKLDEQLTKIKEQTEHIDMLKISEVSNETLKKDNFTLTKRNEYLEKINTGLLDDIGSKEIVINKIQEDKENEFKEMRSNYDDLIKAQEEKLLDFTLQLKLQREKENTVNSEVSNLKHEIEICNNLIGNLQEEGKANNILILELQHKVNDLSENLNKANKKLKNSSNDFLMEKNALENDKTVLEHQSQEHFKEIEKLTVNYMKYKSKAKQLYVEVLRLRSLPEQKNIRLPPSETIEILNDEENNIRNNDVSIFEFNDRNDVDVSMHSSSSKINQKFNQSYVKRNSSFVIPVDQSIIKKRRTADNLATSQILKPRDDVRQAESSLNSSFQHINISPVNKFFKRMENTKENNVPNLKLTPLKKKFDENNEVNSPAVNLSTTLNVDNKKTFRIPEDLQSPQKKTKAKRQSNPKTKPNTPITLTALSSKQKEQQPKSANIK